MKINIRILVLCGVLSSSSLLSATEYKDMVFKAGAPSLQEWILAETPPTPEDNPLTIEGVALGKALFFDPRLSGDKNMSCATCHSPMFGWSDGLPVAKGNKSKMLGRASPVVTNTAYNSIQMWDGRKKSLEDQAMGPMQSNAEMNMNIPELMAFMKNNKEYTMMFQRAYPDEGINETTMAKALASFERTVISRTSAFDKWVEGDEKALTEQQVNGFKVFSNPDKGNCMACHSAPNFTDNGFHNLGLASYGDKEPDLGRYAQKPLGLMKGAFKTPTLRDITLSAPYFHDGSATTLTAVVKHYQTGGVNHDNTSPSLKVLDDLNEEDIKALVAFMETLTSPQENFELPIIPLTH